MRVSDLERSSYLRFDIFLPFGVFSFFLFLSIFPFFANEKPLDNCSNVPSRIRLLPDPFDEAQAIHQCGLSRRFAGTGLTQLDLSQNALLSVPSSALKDLQHLLILNLNRNKIKNIHKKAFEGLDTLEILSLYENEISYIEEDAFTGLHK